VNADVPGEEIDFVALAALDSVTVTCEAAAPVSRNDRRLWRCFQW
jgi:hypothetical protein